MGGNSTTSTTHTLPRWVYGGLLLVLALAGWWVWHEYQSLSAPELAPRDAARRLLDLAEVICQLLAGFCALLSLALWLEGRKLWQTPDGRRRAWAYWLVALLLLVCGWQLKEVLLTRLEARLAAALDPGPSDHETFQLE